jgi:hypothetical protein
MISLVADPKDPSRLVLTATVTLYLEKVLLETLSAELEAAIRSQALKDIRGNKEVRARIAEAAEQKLLSLLNVPETETESK